MNIAVSACLLGTPCRYDGGSKPCETVIALGERHTLVPVCPEVMGGLSTPRTPSEIVCAEPYCVHNAEGADNTEAFVRGAELALACAQEHACELAILKAKSPSCGIGRVYDGTFTGTVIPGDGVTAQLLKANGIQVVGESRAEELLVR